MGIENEIISVKIISVIKISISYSLIQISQLNLVILNTDKDIINNKR